MGAAASIGSCCVCVPCQLVSESVCVAVCVARHGMRGLS